MNDHTRADSSGAPTYDLRSFQLEHLDVLSRDAVQTHLELYAGYVEQTNALLAMNRASASERERGTSPDAELQSGRARRLSFELNGVLLHECFFEQLQSPQRPTAPDPASVFAEAVDAAYGGFGHWRAQVLELAETRGIGWVLGIWDAQTRVLSNIWCDLHHLGMAGGQRIVFALDLWEHAYWIDYGPKRRAAYARAIVENTDWDVVAQRLDA